MEKNIAFRKVYWLDCLFLYHLRNQPETYRHFRDNFPVKLSSHIIWFSKLKLGLSSKQLYIIKLNGKKVGQIRFDRIAKDSSEISISILKGCMGKGIMSSVFFDVAKAYIIRNPEIGKLYANIILGNTASIRFFEKLKFKKIKRKKHEWSYLKKRNEI